MEMFFAIVLSIQYITSQLKKVNKNYFMIGISGLRYPEPCLYGSSVCCEVPPCFSSHMK